MLIGEFNGMNNPKQHTVSMRGEEERASKVEWVQMTISDDL